MGQGEEHGVRLGDGGVDAEPGRRQVGVAGADRLGLAATRLEPDELDRWMTRQQPNELRADVAGRPDDRHADPPVRGARPAVRRDLCGRLEARAHGRTRPLAGGRLVPMAEGIEWTAVMTCMIIR